MNQEQNNLSSLAMNALSEIPAADSNAKQIVALVRESGRVTGYQLSDGRILTKEEGVSLARTGGIKGVGISERNGNPYLKSLPDASEKNNLSSLPSINKAE